MRYLSQKTRDKARERSARRVAHWEIARRMVEALGWTEAKRQSDREVFACVNDVSYPFGRAERTMDIAEAFTTYATAGKIPPGAMPGRDDYRPATRST